MPKYDLDIPSLLAFHRSVFGDTRMEDAGGDGGGDGAGDGGQGGSSFAAITSQEEFDRRVADRLARQKAQFREYDTFKASHDELEKLRAANATEAEKAQKRAEDAEKAVAAAVDRAVKAEIKAIATGEFADPSDAHLYLGDLSRFVDTKTGDVDSGAIEAALKEVEKAKPHLIVRARTDAGLGVRGGNAPVSGNQAMNQQIRQAAGRG